MQQATLPEMQQIQFFLHVRADPCILTSSLMTAKELWGLPSPCLQYSIFGYCEWVTCKFFHGEIKGKTKLCRNFEKHLKCNYGDKCRFAHGPLELAKNISDDGTAIMVPDVRFCMKKSRRKRKSLTDQTLIN